MPFFFFRVVLAFVVVYVVVLSFSALGRKTRNRGQTPAKSLTRFPTFKNEEEEKEKEEKEEEDFKCGLKNNTNNSTVFCLFGENSACEYSSYYFIVIVIVIIVLSIIVIRT